MEVASNTHLKSIVYLRYSNTVATLSIEEDSICNIIWLMCFRDVVINKSWLADNLFLRGMKSTEVKKQYVMMIILSSNFKENLFRRIP